MAAPHQDQEAAQPQPHPGGDRFAARPVDDRGADHDQRDVLPDRAPPGPPPPGRPCCKLYGSRRCGSGSSGQDSSSVSPGPEVRRPVDAQGADQDEPADARPARGRDQRPGGDDVGQEHARRPAPQLRGRVVDDVAALGDVRVGTDPVQARPPGPPARPPPRRPSLAPGRGGRPPDQAPHGHPPVEQLPDQPPAQEPRTAGHQGLHGRPPGPGPRRPAGGHRAPAASPRQDAKIASIRAVTRRISPGGIGRSARPSRSPDRTPRTTPASREVVQIRAEEPAEVPHRRPGRPRPSAARGPRPWRRPRGARPWRTRGGRRASGSTSTPPSVPKTRATRCTGRAAEREDEVGRDSLAPEHRPQLGREPAGGLLAGPGRPDASGSGSGRRSVIR